MKISVLRFPGLRPFLLSLVVIATFASKILHVVQHFRSVSKASFFFYLPTFFLFDFLVSTFAWIALSRFSGAWSIAGLIIVGCLGVFDLGVVSSQFGFFYVTGAEVRWDAASSLASDAAGLKLLLSGLVPVFAAGTMILSLTWIVAPLVMTIFDSWFSAIGDALVDLTSRSYRYLPLSYEPKRHNLRKYIALFVTTFVLIIVIFITMTRPSIPYNHMSGTVPFTLAAIFEHQNKTCLSPEQQTFPLTELTESHLWEPENGRYKGWKPGFKPVEGNISTVTVPSWAPETWPRGFGRWVLEPENSTQEASLPVNDDDYDDASCPSMNHTHNTYDPVLDPMRITNLDLELLAPVQKVLEEHQVPIKHIFLIEMESARKDVFPLRSGSHLHQEILDSYGAASLEDLEDLTSRLAALTPVAEQITGESGDFQLESPELKNNLTSRSWEDKSDPGMGGINVLGAVTGSSLSFKSVLGSHCGVGPIPVDFMFETNAEIYQPCMMHILRLFNELKKERKVESKDMRSQKWKSVFLQSVTGQFEDQNKLNEQMGFDQSIFKENINTQKAKYYHEDMEEINYFGYPEVEVLPYLKDTIEEAKSNGERLFLSHFTSTTHHPWGVPSDFKSENYWFHKQISSEHQNINKYLNTVRYVDTWLGNIMKVVEDAGIVNETLMVFVGDHGQAFSEDSHITGTFENGHVSNFKVPLVFRHPLLPRLDVMANASSISILPTILDLLINTDSLDDVDKDAASDLIHEYEGQSLLRPYKTTHNGRQAWNMGIINTGGTMLSVASAAAPYRLIFPLTRDFTYVFSDLSQDPYEKDVVEDWNFYSLVPSVKKKYGREAAHWLKEAELVARWWVDEKKRLWNYHEG